MKYFKEPTEKKLTESNCHGESNWVEISEEEAKVLSTIPEEEDWEYALTGQKDYLKKFRTLSKNRWIEYPDGGKYDRVGKRRYD